MLPKGFPVSQLNLSQLVQDHCAKDTASNLKDDSINHLLEIQFPRARLHLELVIFCVHQINHLTGYISPCH